MSDCGLAGVPRKSSGAMNVGVPASGALPCARSSSRRTRPKSVSLARPSGVSSTLAGLTSRCTSPASCAAWSASPTCLASIVGTQRLERALAHQRFTQGQPARNVLHLDEMKSVQTSEIMDRDDVRVDQVRGGPRLGPELLANSRLFDIQRRVHDLERAVPPELEMPRLVNPGHRSPADDRLDLILADLPAEQRVRGRVRLVQTWARLRRAPGEAWITVSSSSAGRRAGDFGRALDPDGTVALPASAARISRLRRRGRQARRLEVPWRRCRGGVRLFHQHRFDDGGRKSIACKTTVIGKVDASLHGPTRRISAPRRHHSIRSRAEKVDRKTSNFV